MAQRAEVHDVWSVAGQQWLQDQLNLTPGRDALVRVVDNRVEVALTTGIGSGTWVYESGGEWVVQCSVHGSSCGTPFTANDGATVRDHLELWASGHA